MPLKVSRVRWFSSEQDVKIISTRNNAFLVVCHVGQQRRKGREDDGLLCCLLRLPHPMIYWLGSKFPPLVRLVVCTYTKTDDCLLRTSAIAGAFIYVRAARTANSVMHAVSYDEWMVVKT